MQQMMMKLLVMILQREQCQYNINNKYYIMHTGFFFLLFSFFPFFSFIIFIVFLIYLNYYVSNFFFSFFLCVLYFPFFFLFPFFLTPFFFTSPVFDLILRTFKNVFMNFLRYCPFNKFTFLYVYWVFIFRLTRLIMYIWLFCDCVYV